MPHFANACSDHQNVVYVDPEPLLIVRHGYSQDDAERDAEEWVRLHGAVDAYVARKPDGRLYGVLRYGNRWCDYVTLSRNQTALARMLNRLRLREPEEIADA